MDDIKSTYSLLEIQIEKTLEAYPSIADKLQFLANLTGSSKSSVLIGSFGLFSLILLSLGVGDVLIDIIGFIYPLYSSVKSIESLNRKEEVNWLMYWIIFGSFKLFETFFKIFLPIIPFYFIFKGFFLIWCFSPTTKGSTRLYHMIIKKYILAFFNQFSTKNPNYNEQRI